MKRKTSQFGIFNNVPLTLRGLGEGDSGGKDESNCEAVFTKKGYSKDTLKAYRDCEEAYWGRTAGDCHTWKKMAENRTQAGDAACKATGRTSSDNPCLELAHSCLSTVICQVFNYIYAQGQFAKECGDYGPVVAGMFWPVFNFAINAVQGKVPCSLQVNADRIHASSAVLPMWYGTSFLARYESAILAVTKVWQIARAKYGLPPAPVCIEPSTLGIETTLTQIDGPQTAIPGELYWGACDQAWDDRTQQIQHKKYCACGKGYNAEHALLAWASRFGSRPLAEISGCHKGYIDGDVNFCSDAVDYANIQRPPNENFGDRAHYPFSLYWTGRATFKKCDPRWWEIAQEHAALITGARLAAMEEAILPVMAACFAQAWKERQSTILKIPGLSPGASSLISAKDQLKVTRLSSFQKASPSKFSVIQSKGKTTPTISAILKDKKAATYALVGTAALLVVVGALVIKKRAKPNRRRFRRR